MGSGHILIAMFDVLMDIYKSAGYSERDAAFLIVENNIHGLDIDKRAYQLAYFAVMMKGRGYNRRFFSGKQNEDGERVAIQPQVYVIEESNGVNRTQLKYFGADLSETEKNESLKQMNELLEELKDATEYGSILNISNYNWDLLDRFVSKESSEEQISFDSYGISDTQYELRYLVNVGRILNRKYMIVSTNPPYVASSNASSKVQEYIAVNYPAGKTDLFAVFIERCRDFIKLNGFQAMITQHSWMFLSSFETLRNNNMRYYLVNMVHLGARGFDDIGGEVVQTCAFVFKKSIISKCIGVYCRLTAQNSQEAKRDSFLSGQNRYYAKFSKFELIPGAPIAYWLTENFASLFKNRKLGEVATPKVGLQTGENARFIRLWYEVSREKEIFCDEDEEKNIKKWFPYNKGGEYRKWYGNYEYVVNWYRDGKEIKNFKDSKGKLKSRPQNIEYYFKPSITWSFVSTTSFGARYSPKKAIFDVAGSSLFPCDEDMLYIEGLLCSKLSTEFMMAQNPTMNFQVGNVANIPIVYENKNYITELVRTCVDISKVDWDSYETSWDFPKHPLLKNVHVYSTRLKSKSMYLSETDIQSFKIPTRNLTVKSQKWELSESDTMVGSRISGESFIANAFEEWNQQCNDRFNQLKANEEELNRIFIDIYGLQDELTPEVDDKDVTVRKADLQRDIKSLISYAVGCIFGRYTLDVDGIAYAGGEWDSTKYTSFIPDADNIIPITDEEYFSDDIVERFCEWLKVVYGEDTLEENLDFIAQALGNKGDTSREVIRNYFLNDFIKDHIKIYQKRPIYWLFDSGKANGFKALIYMHRYNPDTVGTVRTEYLHKTQKAIEQAMERATYISANGSGSEKAKATKQITKYTKQLAEIHTYDEAMAHIANQRIEIDLDDGVKVNYAKFQGVEVAQEGKKALKVDLLAKI